MLKIIEARGDHFACGYQFGVAAKENIEYRMKHFSSESAFKKHKKALFAVHETCKEYYPEFVREIEGMSLGAQVDYWKLLFFNLPEIESRKNGCTSIAGVLGEHIFLAHNEDGERKERLEDCFLVHYVLPGVSFYAFVYAGEIPSGSYSWNSHGVYFSVNYVEPIHPDINGRVSRCFVARRLIEAKSVKEGIAQLKLGHEASGYHYYLGKGRELFSVEQFRDSVSVQKMEGLSIHSNHYLHPAFAKNAPSDKHSRLRYQRACRLAAEGKDPLGILADRKYAPYSICTKPLERLQTISTIRFLPLEHKVELYEPLSLKKVQTFSL